MWVWRAVKIWVAGWRTAEGQIMIVLTLVWVDWLRGDGSDIFGDDEDEDEGTVSDRNEDRRLRSEIVWVMIVSTFMAFEMLSDCSDEYVLMYVLSIFLAHG